MGAGKGKKKQEASDEVELSEISSGDDAVANCEETKAQLQVFVVKAGTDVGIEGLSASASGAADLPAKASAADTGLVDFGDVDPGSYEIKVELDDEQKKKFAEPRSRTVLTKEGHLTKVFLSVSPFATLRVVVLGWDAKAKADAPLGDLDWKATKPSELTGKTKPDGLIEIPLDGGDTAARVSVDLRPAPGPVPAADPDVARDAEAYPPKVQHQLYKDEDATSPIPPREAVVVKWNLDVVPPDAATGDDGSRARLQNLGFQVAPGADAAKTTRAVRAYQALYASDRDGSGAIADIEADLETRHDEA